MQAMSLYTDWFSLPAFVTVHYLSLSQGREGGGNNLMNFNGETKWKAASKCQTRPEMVILIPTSRMEPSNDLAGFCVSGIEHLNMSINLYVITLQYSEDFK
jgi:hypothetical protein